MNGSRPLLQPDFRTEVPAGIIYNRNMPATLTPPVNGEETQSYRKFAVASDKVRQNFSQKQIPVHAALNALDNEESARMVLLHDIEKDVEFVIEHGDAEKVMSILAEAKGMSAFFTASADEGSMNANWNLLDGWKDVTDPLKKDMELRNEAMRLLLLYFGDAKAWEALIGPYSKEGKDGKTIIDFEKFNGKLDELIEKYLKTALFNSGDKSDVSGKNAALEWAKKMGFENPESMVYKDAEDNWCVFMDVKPLMDAQELLIRTWDKQGEGGLTSAELSALMTGLDSQQKKIDSMMQKVTQSNTYAKEHEDTVLKFLSTQMAVEAENVKKIWGNM